MNGAREADMWRLRDASATLPGGAVKGVQMHASQSSNVPGGDAEL